MIKVRKFSEKFYNGISIESEDAKNILETNLSRIDELFTNPVSYRIVKETTVDFKCRFIIDDINITVHLKLRSLLESKDSWELSFTNPQAYDPYGITGTGYAFRIFATIMSILKKWSEKYKGEYLYFFAANEPSRIKFYTKLAKNLSRVIPYSYISNKTVNDPGSFVFQRR